MTWILLQVSIDIELLVCSHHHLLFYSLRNELAGFAKAARSERYPTVKIAITKITPSAKANMIGLNSILY